MTRLGIKASALATIMCISAMALGYVSTVLIAGYILLAEQDKMLRNTALKSLAIICLAAIGITAINLLPNFIGWISDFVGIFDGSLRIGILSLICSWLVGTVNLAETVILAIMAFMAFKGKELSIPFIDKFLKNAEQDELSEN